MKIKTKIKCPCGSETPVITRKPHVVQPTIDSVACVFCDSVITFKIMKGETKHQAKVENLRTVVTEKAIDRIKINHLNKKIGIATD